MKEKLVLFLLLIVFNFSIFSSCSDRKPKTIQDRESLKKDIEKIESKEKLSSGETLIEEVKNPALLPDYSIVSYEYLDQDSLYKKINGAADSYIANHGFIGCAYAQLKHKLSGSVFIIYIYDMGKEVNAFGIYSSERNPNYNFIDIDKGAYLEGSSLVFWKSKYYIKVELQSSNAKGKELLTSLAERLSSVVEDNKDAIAFAEHFPKDKQIKHSLKYYHANFDSQVLFKYVYEIKYNISGKEASIFTARFNDKTSLNKALEEYREFLSINKLTKEKNFYIGKDSLENRLCIFAIENNYLIGAFNFSKKEGQQKINKLISSLKNS